MQQQQPPPPPPPPPGGRGEQIGRMARLGYLARWACDRCGLGFDDFDTCAAHEAGCAGGGAPAAAAAQPLPGAPVVIPQDEDDGARPAAARHAHRPQLPHQPRPHHLQGQPTAPAVIPIHNDGDTSAGGSVAAARAREESSAVDLTRDDSDEDDEDDVVVVDDGAKSGRQDRASSSRSGNYYSNGNTGGANSQNNANQPPLRRNDVVTVWTCDVCGTAEFTTFDAAAAHEEACAAAKEREGAAAAVGAAREETQNRLGVWQQQQQRQQQPPFPSAQDPIPLGMVAAQPRPLQLVGVQPQPRSQLHEQRGQQQQQQGRSGNSKINPTFHVNPTIHVRNTRYWTCDVCNSSFQSYEEACKHERICEGNPHAPVKSVTTFRGADGQPTSDEASQLTEPVTLDDDHEAPPSRPPHAQSHAQLRQNQPWQQQPTQSVPQYWTCDHCHVARFDTYADASAHERICMVIGKKPDRSDGGTGATSKAAVTAPERRPAVAEEAAVSREVNARKRPSSDSEVNDNASIDSYPTDRKRKAKRQKKRRSVDNEDTETVVFMVDQDLDGHEYYVPPAGGVPLVSSQSATMFSQLSLYYQIVISNLELCSISSGDEAKGSVLRLRCHNCKSNPQLNTFKILSSVTRQNWHRAVKQLAKHVEGCPCLAPHIKENAKSSQRNKKEKSMVAYCESLSNLYSMKDSRHGLIWGDCSTSQDASDAPKNVLATRLPRHNLMLSQTSAPRRMVIPDYYFFLASQYHFALVKRDAPPPKGGMESMNAAKSDLTLAIRCRHCLSSRALESIRDGCSSSRYLLGSHFGTCPVAAHLARRLENMKKSKVTQEKLSSTSVTTCVGNTMTKVYGMVDLEWNGSFSGVGFSGGVDDAMRRLSRKYKIDATSWESFALPLLTPDLVHPFTDGLQLDAGSDGRSSSS